ncbi:MAG: universal stress protein UspA [Clostridia bacterium]|nr:universal stress protein UspA [Clostridia bacterium]
MSTPRNILVCVTQQKTCERLIREAAKLRDDHNSELFIIHVAKNGWNFLDNIKEGEALEYLFAISKSVGANLTVLKSDEIINTIIGFINENNIGHVVMGQSPGDHKENNFSRQLKRALSDIEILIIP